MISIDRARESQVLLRYCLREDHAGVRLVEYMDVLASLVG